MLGCTAVTTLERRHCVARSYVPASLTSLFSCSVSLSPVDVHSHAAWLFAQEFGPNSGVSLFWGCTGFLVLTHTVPEPSVCPQIGASCVRWPTQPMLLCGNVCRRRISLCLRGRLLRAGDVEPHPGPVVLVWGGTLLMIIWLMGGYLSSVGFGTDRLLVSLPTATRQQVLVATLSQPV